MELVKCDFTGTAPDGSTFSSDRPGIDAERGCHDVPCVLSSSLQFGDQMSDVTDVFSERVCIGMVVDVEFTFQIRTLPSGYVDPVARRLVFHGHHASA